jgi:hypothetical protein
VNTNHDSPGRKLTNVTTNLIVVNISDTIEVTIKLTGDTEMRSNVCRDIDHDRIHHYQHNRSRQLYSETQDGIPEIFQ